MGNGWSKKKTESIPGNLNAKTDCGNGRVSTRLQRVKMGEGGDLAGRVKRPKGRVGRTVHFNNGGEEGCRCGFFKVSGKNGV